MINLKKFILETLNIFISIKFYTPYQMETIQSVNNLNKVDGYLSKINDILRFSDWDSKKIRCIKSKLSELVKNKQYRDFQESIWMKVKECDGILWQHTINQLKQFISWLKTNSIKNPISKISQSLARVFWWSKIHSQSDNESSVNKPIQLSTSISCMTSDSGTYWTENSPQSKLWLLKQILKKDIQEDANIQIKKAYLRRLLNEGKYKLFQSTIGINIDYCDWKLGQTSLNQCLHYLWLKLAIPLNSSRTLPYFWDTPLSCIISYKSIQNEETDNYCCSKTARLNGKKFWLNLPKWNAYDVWALQPKNSIATIPYDKTNIRPTSNRRKITLSQFNWIEPKANFIDFFAESKSKYWHRAIAFRDKTGQWYVLDPYIPINWKLYDTPIKLNTYLSLWRKIVKAHLYHSNGYTSCDA